MDVLRSENGPLGTVEGYVWKKRVSETRGSPLAYASLVKPGTAPDRAIVAKLPQCSVTTDKTCLSKKACDANDAA